MKNLLLLALVVLTLSSCNQNIEKTGFVNNTKVVSEYSEMKAAQDKWTKKNTEVRSELEQKAQQFQIEVQGYQTIMKSMTPANREKKEQELMAKQQQLQREQQVRMQEIQQGSQAEIDSIISKVKDFVKEYGEKNGYTYIFGQNEVGNLFYAKEDKDLTDEILEELNKAKTESSDSTKTTTESPEEKPVETVKDSAQ